jgi:RHS repeat-associated protein
LSTTAYGPYGEGVPPAGINIGFAGQRYDSETGLYYYKRRYYSVGIGRFLQTDPALYGDLDCGCGCDSACSDSSITATNTSQLNLYAAMRNDPLNLTDPSGLSPVVAAPPVTAPPGLGLGGGASSSGILGLTIIIIAGGYTIQQINRMYAAWKNLRDTEEQFVQDEYAKCMDKAAKDRDDARDRLK